MWVVLSWPESSLGFFCNMRSDELTKAVNAEQKEKRSKEGALGSFSGLEVEEYQGGFPTKEVEKPRRMATWVQVKKGGCRVHVTVDEN